MSNRGLRIAVLALLLLVAGCTNMNPLQTTQTTLLEQYQQVRGWSAAQTESGVAGFEVLSKENPSEVNRLKLALALGFGKGAATDTKRALQLFDEVAKTQGLMSANEALFAGVFADILKERVQSDARSGGLGRQLESLTRQAESERQRADELEKKLNALKSIEKSLRKR